MGSQNKKKYKIDAVRVLPLYGTAVMFETIEKAIVFVKKQPEDGRSAKKPLVRIEVQVRYANGNRIEGQLTNKIFAVKFLHKTQEGLF